MAGKPLTPEAVVQRFHNNCDIDAITGCWEWNKSCYWNGYAIFRHMGEVFGHRYSYRLYNGEIPDGLFVLHKCDNRRCCNPTHLELGTQQDNQTDMANKNRCMFGSRHKRAKLTEDLVRQMRTEYIPYYVSVRSIADKYNVSITACTKALAGDTWRRVV